MIKLASVGRCAIFIALIAGILGTNRDGHHIVLNGVVQDARRKFNVECDEGVLTEAEFNDIKRDLLNKNVAEKQSFESDIDKVKKLKVYLDEKVLTEQEFVAEKSKILKK